MSWQRYRFIARIPSDPDFIRLATTLQGAQVMAQRYTKRTIAWMAHGKKDYVRLWTENDGGLDDVRIDQVWENAG